jgi:hypothetical protein
MSSRVSYEDAFSTPEYVAFKEAISKTSLDNRLHIKNNHISVGKLRFRIPNFVNAKGHLEELELERSQLLMRYNDVYEKIVVADRPERYKQPFNDLVTKISNVEVLMDELQTFIQARNVVNIKDNLQQELDANNIKWSTLIDNSTENIVVDNGTVKEVIALYKNNISLHNALNDAKHILPHDYIILEKKLLKEEASSKTLKHTTLTKRQKVKSAVKKLMIDKL